MADHKATAEAFLRDAASSTSSGMVAEFINRAQVHAVLELAEQQHIANLIALLPHVDGESYDRLVPAIYAGLGVES